MFAVGFITAFVVALIAIKTFLQLIKRISFIPFAIYRFIVAAAVYVVFFLIEKRFGSRLVFSLAL